MPSHICTVLELQRRTPADESLLAASGLPWCFAAARWLQGLAYLHDPLPVCASSSGEGCGV